MKKKNWVKSVAGFVYADTMKAINASCTELPLGGGNAAGLYPNAFSLQNQKTKGGWLLLLHFRVVRIAPQRYKDTNMGLMNRQQKRRSLSGADA